MPRLRVNPKPAAHSPTLERSNRATRPKARGADHDRAGKFVIDRHHSGHPHSCVERLVAMNIKPPRTLQIALGLSGKAVDGRYGTSTRALMQTTLLGINPAATTDWLTWPTERQAVLC